MQEFVESHDDGAYTTIVRQCDECGMAVIELFSTVADPDNPCLIEDCHIPMEVATNTGGALIRLAKWVQENKRKSR